MVTLWGAGGWDFNIWILQGQSSARDSDEDRAASQSDQQSDRGPSCHRHTGLLCSNILHCPLLTAVTTEFVIPAKVWWWLLLTPPAPCFDVSEFSLSSSLRLYGGAIDQSCEIFWSKHCLSQLSFFLFVPSTLFDSYLNGCLHHHLFKTFLPPCQVPLSFTCPRCFPAARGPVSEIFLSRDQLHNICCWPHERWVSRPPRQGGGQKNTVFRGKTDLDSNSDCSLAFETCQVQHSFLVYNMKLVIPWMLLEKILYNRYKVPALLWYVLS